MLHTPICDYFGIKYPILLAGMGGVAMHKLVAAVSNAGGLGVIGAASLSPDDLRDEIRATRELTDKPFAVDLLAPIPDMMRPHVPVMIEEKVKVFVAGLSVPQEFVKAMQDHGNENRRHVRQGASWRVRRSKRAPTWSSRKAPRPAGIPARSG